MAQLKKSHFPIKGFPISSGFVSKVVSSQFTTYLCIAATICLFKWPSNTCLKIEASRHATCYLSIGLKSFLTHLLDEKYNLFHSLSSLWWQIFLFSLLAFFLHFAIFSLPCQLQSGTRCGWSILPPLLNFFNFPILALVRLQGPVSVPYIRISYQMYFKPTYQEEWTIWEVEVTDIFLGKISLTISSMLWQGFFITVAALSLTRLSYIWKKFLATNFPTKVAKKSGDFQKHHCEEKW